MEVVTITKKISIIVPVYNSEKTIERCLTSVINQEYKNLEIIIINDGSTDDSLNICNKFSKKDSRIKVLDQENKGVSSARNTGLRAATGDVITFVDSDDYIEGHMYSELIAAMDVYDADVVETGVKKINFSENKETILTPEFKLISGNEEILKNYLIREPRLNYTVNKLFSKDIIANLHFENLKYSEDYLWNVQALINSNTFVSLPLIHYYYVQHSSSATNQVFSEDNFDILKASNLANNIVKKDSPKNLINTVIYQLEYMMILYVRMKNENKDKFNNEIRKIVLNYRNIFSKFKKELFLSDIRLKRKLVFLLFYIYPKSIEL